MRVAYLNGQVIDRNAGQIREILMHGMRWESLDVSLLQINGLAVSRQQVGKQAAPRPGLRGGTSAAQEDAYLLYGSHDRSTVKCSRP